MPAAAEWSTAGELLVVFGRVGAVGFGGGQAMIPIIEVACVPGTPVIPFASRKSPGAGEGHRV